MTVNQHNVVHILPRVFEFKSFPVTIVTESISINDFSNGGHTPEFESIWSIRTQLVLIEKAILF